MNLYNIWVSLSEMGDNNDWPFIKIIWDVPVITLKLNPHLGVGDILLDKINRQKFVNQ